ncbi:MAG TPA: class I SAM-dependent methyltransferase [Actinomycetota bacterium]|nr:class I SAM-dependent methyltransferase [Actinomycetota bacterium]
MTWDPDTYPATIRDEIHDYDELQEQVVTATSGISVRNILELGVGAGETAARLLRAHPQARLVGIDSSEAMLRGAEEILSPQRATLLLQHLSAPLPERRFDLVVSALAIHHLEGDAKADLFRSVRNCLAPGGLFVVGDVVVPEDPEDAVIGNEPGYDFPSTIDDQLRWLTEAGFLARVVWTCRDLAVVRAEVPPP